MPTQSFTQSPAKKWNTRLSWGIPVSNHFGPEVLATNAAAYSRAFETSQEPTHVSSPRWKNIPKDRKITYGKIVCDYKPHKQEKERVRLTVGGDKLDYSGDVATSTADITTFKILINITLSTKDAAMMMMDIKNYYLGTPLPRFEYMKILLSRFPEEIIQKYNLNALAVDGWVYIEIRKCMYGLKQAGLLANQLLQTRLAPFGYYPDRHTPGLWLHKTRPISFTPVVDDFEVKYVGKHHA
jgi:hypothetical protein